MGRPKLAAPEKKQLIFEKGLMFAVWLFGTLYMLLAVFRYVIDYRLITPYIKWYAALLTMAFLMYLLMTKHKYPQTMYRIRNFMKQMKSYEQIFLIVLFIWFVIACLVCQTTEHKNYFQTADWWLLDSAVSALVMFPLVFYLITADKRQYINLLLHIVALSYTAFSAWCLWHVFHLNILTLPSGNQIGMTSGMELNLGCHYNITGALAFTVLAIACYMMFTQKAAWKVIYGIVVAIQLWISLLSNSRTVYVCVLFLGAVCAFLCGLNLLKKTKTVIRLAVSSLMAVICVLALWKLRSIVFVLFDSVTNFTTLIGGQVESAEDAVRELVGLSGRVNIWIGAVKAMVSSPVVFFFGVTPFRVTSVLREYGGLSFDPAHAHNIILQVGISMGVPAMIAFIIYLIKIAVRCIRSVWKATGKELNRSVMVAVIIASLVMMNMMEAYLIAYFSLMSTIFFLACGDVTCTDQKKRLPDKAQ